MNSKGGSGDVSALKGGKKGKGGKGKGWKGYKGKYDGKGRGNFNNYNYNNCAKSPGKAIGKGLNNFNYDYQDAWGEELSNGWGADGDDWWTDE